ncbi:MAG: ABC transporter permease [Syntrophobacteraceae bacterium CG2_30_61_12]|nr:MAG: ABC transporter permease [Syntrophobacteraceae bacterium CG2_30_61_12]PIU32466.1 MAG: ABC transporter permease [Syntrophobacteraceae bacterium CG07_land_8_20_14_0_80_61_8]
MNHRQVTRAVEELVMVAAIVLVFISAILVLAGAPVLEVHGLLVTGAVGSWSKLAQVLRVWVPLTLCSCGLLYTFQIGLWNIGVEGQVMLGAIGATAVLRLGFDSALPGAVLGAALVVGMLGGALWALLAGLLKTWGGVNEIFAGLGLNFVAQGLILWLIFGPWRRPGVASMSGTEPFAESLWFPTPAVWRISPHALGLTLVALAATALVLRHTRLGLALRAVGGNPSASYLFGLKPGRLMLWAMGLAGALAGLAGTLQVTVVYHRLIPAISSNYGYLALLVVMLADYRLSWVPFIAFFFAALNVGSIQLPLVLQLDSSLSGVIQGALVLTVLLIHAWNSGKAGTRWTT